MTNTTKEAPDNIDWTEGQSLIDFFNGSLEVRADLIPAMLAAAREEGALAMREAACVVAAYSGAKQMPSDGSYSHHEPVMGPDVAGAILAIDPKEVTK